MADSPNFTSPPNLSLVQSQDSSSLDSIVQSSRDRMVTELAASGITILDLHTRLLQNPERAATNLPHSAQGYVIPYFDLEGLPYQFYRVKVFDSNPKYKQIKGSPNHLFIPLGTKDLAIAKGYLIITEGEKKAQCAFKRGFPCIAIGGVDSWRNRTLILPQNTKFANVVGQESISVKLNDVEGRIDDSNLATGFQSVLDLCVEHNIALYICFDNDSGEQDGLTKFQVQQSCAKLAFELRFKGIRSGQIRQLFLENIPNNPNAGPDAESDSDSEILQKVGLDDFLVKRKDGTAALQALIDRVARNPHSFPKHPNIVEYIQRRLQNPHPGRKELQQTAMSIISDLDSYGRRLIDKNTGGMFFFINQTKQLISASMRANPGDAMQNTEFTRYLFQKYGVSQSDRHVINWIATYYTTEHPIVNVEPQRVTCVRDDFIYQQINDGQFLKVSPSHDTPFEICDNGHDNILFEANRMEPLDSKQFLAHCEHLLAESKEVQIKPWWLSVLRETRLRYKGDNEYLLTLLFYISPWLQRWRGTQLPIEMALGEAGSGKSSLYELRMRILSGRPELRNAPQKISDWYASIGNAAGMHVVDNLHISDKNLRQQLSDEMCRLTTEPQPKIEQRLLYSNNELSKVPINTTFAVTAIQQPFHNSDIMQRSIVMEFDKGSQATTYEMEWVENRIRKFGGRTNWLAHHMVVLHKFLAHAKTKWNNDFHAKFRLINIEQCFTLLAEIFSLDTAWIQPLLTQVTDSNVVSADWSFEGFAAFAQQWWEVNKNLRDRSNRPLKFDASEICDWAQSQPDFEECFTFRNARSCGRYMNSHRQMLSTICGYLWLGKYGNKEVYSINMEKLNNAVHKRLQRSNNRDV